MRVLIAGAAGFIGSHLTDLLIEQGHEVVGVDNFITGDRDKLAHLKNQPKFNLIEHEVAEQLKIDGPIDRIFHLASPATPVGYGKNQVATIKANGAGTWNLLELAIAKNARFLLASTSEIYGDPAIVPQPENYWGNVNSIGLRSMYDEAKRFAEATTMAYHRERNADTRIVRIFNTFGPRMNPHGGRVVSTFVRQALSNEPLTVYGDGTQSRSLCYVSDTIRGLAAAIEADFHEPINIGNPDVVSIFDLAQEILTLIPQSRSKVLLVSRPDYDPRVLKPVLMRAKQLLGWTPTVSRREGLTNLIEYFRRLPN